MASVTLRNTAFPVGASIGAYLLTQKAPYVNAAPTGAAVTTATVAADGSVSFAGLASSTRYTAYYTPGGSDFRYVDFTTDSGARQDSGAGEHPEAYEDVKLRLWSGSNVAQNMPRRNAGGNTAAPVSGTLLLAGDLVLPKGRTVSRVVVVSGTTAGVALTHQVFSLYRQSDLGLIRATADDTSTAWGADTEKSLALSSPYTPVEDLAVYVGILITVTTTVPTLSGTIMKNVALSGASPALAATADTGLTGTPASLPATAGALTAVVGVPFVAVR